jgi:hypothetical protein
MFLNYVSSFFIKQGVNFIASQPVIILLRHVQILSRFGHKPSLPGRNIPQVEVHF